jgi:hypothetical protein
MFGWHLGPSGETARQKISTGRAQSGNPAGDMGITTYG